MSPPDNEMTKDSYRTLFDVLYDRIQGEERLADDLAFVIRRFFPFGDLGTPEVEAVMRRYREARTRPDAPGFDLTGADA